MQLLLLTLCLALFATGCSRVEKVERHLARGQKFSKAEEYNKAEIEFLNVLRLQPTNAVAVRELGLTYYQQGRWLRSYAFLQRANEINPGNDEVRLRLAAILVAVRNLKESRTHAEAVLARNPANEEALMLLAETIISTNDISATRRQLELSRPQAERKAGFHLADGITEMRSGRTNEAAAAFQRALSIDPKSSAVQVALGNLAALSLDNPRVEFHLKKAAEFSPVRSPRQFHYPDFKTGSGDLPSAKAFLEDITKRAPDFVPAYSRLAEIALTEGKFDAAAALAKKVLGLDPGNYDGLLLSARVRVAKGDARGALAEFERLATAYPRIPAVHYHVAVAYLFNDNPARAMDSLRQAVAVDPKHVDSVLLLAELNLRQNNFGAAISALKQLVQEQPLLLPAHLALARTYRSANQPAQALQVYEHAIKSFPRNSQARFSLGQLLLAEGRKDAAKQTFEQVIELAPDFLPAWDELTNLDIAAKQFSAAQSRIASGLARNPKAVALHVIAARVYSAQTNYASAEQALSRALEIDPNYDPAQLALARVYIDSNRSEAAVAKLNALVARSTNYVAGWLQLGLVHHQRKDYEAARIAYEKLLVIDPKFLPALNNLAALYSEQPNQLDRAYALARSARELRPNDAVTADTLGWILYKRGDYSSALPLFEESAEKLNQSAEIQFHLGMTYSMLGNAPAARRALEKALALGEDFPGKAEAQARLALLSESTQPLSVAALEKQLATNPRDPFLLTRLAAAYEEANAFDKAAAAYESAIQQNPRNVSAMLRLAQLYAGPLRDPAKALQTARTARAISPDDRAIAQVLGRLAFASGDYKWSLSLLEEGARGLNGQPEVLYDLAWARYGAGRVSEAVAAMKQALGAARQFSHESDARRFIEINATALALDKSDVAATRINAALKQDSTYVPALFASATIQQSVGNAPAARQQYQAILKQFPDFAPAHKGLAILLSQTNASSDAALHHATRAREALPNDLEVVRALGVIAFHRKDYSRAAQLLKQFSAAAPQDAEALYYLGMAHFHLNEKDASRAALKRAVALDDKAGFVADARRTLAQLN